MLRSRTALVVALLLVVTAVHGAMPPEAKKHPISEHSLHPPFLTASLGHRLDGWSFGGSTVVSNDVVRLTPSKQSREGWLWNEVAVNLDSWVIFYGVRVHAATTLGGDGLAFWLTDRTYQSGGPVVGAPSSGIRGLGIIFDSFDNDGQRDNPYIHVVYSDQATRDGDLDPQRDFPSRVEGCLFDFRNSAKHNVVDVRVEYDSVRQTLDVAVASSTTMMHCATVERLVIPRGFYMGFTAHTGQLADNHDLHYVSLIGKDASVPTPDAATTVAAEET